MPGSKKEVPDLNNQLFFIKSHFRPPNQKEEYIFLNQAFRM